VHAENERGNQRAYCDLYITHSVRVDQRAHVHMDRNLAAAYIETGRTAQARQALLQLVEDGRSRPDERCRARLSLAELRIEADTREQAHARRCGLLSVELHAAEDACRQADLSRSALARLSQDLLRVRAEAQLQCFDVSNDDAEHAVAKAAAALRPTSAHSWRTLCWSLLLLEVRKDPRQAQDEEDAHTPRMRESARESTSSSRCWDALGRLQDRRTPPWVCQLLAAVALAIPWLSLHTVPRPASEQARLRHVLARVRRSQELVGSREVERLFEYLHLSAPPTLRPTVHRALDELQRARGDGEGGGEGGGGGGAGGGAGGGGHVFSLGEGEEMHSQGAHREGPKEDVLLSEDEVREYLNLSSSAKVVGINWSLDPFTGWGNYGLQLVTQLLQSGRFHPLLLHTPSPLLVRECRRVLRLGGAAAAAQDSSEVEHGHVSLRAAYTVLTQGSWAAHILSLRERRERGGGNGVGFMVIHASKRFFFGENETVWGTRNIAITFFEKATDVQAHRLHRASRYDIVVLGCSWARGVVSRALRAHFGRDVEAAEQKRYQRVLQGVSPLLFSPAQHTHTHTHTTDTYTNTTHNTLLQATGIKVVSLDMTVREGGRRDRGRRGRREIKQRADVSGGTIFRIFSGGKLERRKGQDIVLEVFRRFHSQHPRTQLVTAWYNGFTTKGGTAATVISMKSPYTLQDPSVSANGAVAVEEWAAAHGLPRGAIVSAQHVIQDGEGPGGKGGGAALGAAELQRAMSACDAGIFLSRAEGGSNLMAMEALAVGLAVVLSNNTGHVDIVSPEWSYPVWQQHATGDRGGEGGGRRGAPEHVLEGWGESDVNEAVRALERIYAHRGEARERGRRAARFVREQLTWEHTGKTFGDILAALS